MKYANNTWEIYVLIDPSESTVRYVGVSHYTSRLVNHLSSARTVALGHKNNWIRKLLARNERPIYWPVERGTGDSWQSAEIWWIKFYKTNGFRLTNHAAGGAGTANRRAFQRCSLSPDQRARQSAAQKIRFSNPKEMERALINMELARAVRARNGVSVDTRNKQSKSLRGLIISEARRKKMSDAHKGKKHHPESVAKIVANNTGRKQGADEIRRRSLSLRGLLTNDERLLMKKESQERAKMKKRIKRERQRTSHSTKSINGI